MAFGQSVILCNVDRLRWWWRPKPLQLVDESGHSRLEQPDVMLEIPMTALQLIAPLVQVMENGGVGITAVGALPAAIRWPISCQDISPCIDHRNLRCSPRWS